MFLLVFDVLLGVRLELFEGLRTENVLDAAGILRSDLVIDAEGGQKCRQYGVTLVNGLCDLETRLGQTEQTVLVDGNITVIAQQADCSADAGLGEAGIMRYVDRAHLTVLLHENKNSFQIVFRAFLDLQSARPPLL